MWFPTILKGRRIVIERLHTLTHQIPGVPEHDDRAHAERTTPHLVGHRPHLQNRAHRPSGEPRVFVRWQRWIASLGSVRKS
jgi:hypothetical protein